MLAIPPDSPQVQALGMSGRSFFSGMGVGSQIAVRHHQTVLPQGKPKQSQRWGADRPNSMLCRIDPVESSQSSAVDELVYEDSHFLADGNLVVCPGLHDQRWQPGPQRGAGKEPALWLTSAGHTRFPWFQFPQIAQALYMC